MASNDKKGVTILSTSNGAFSGADAVASIIFPGCKAITLGQVTTLTYSTYRETTPVRTLGRINVKGFARGQRTIAGTIIFTVFEKHVVNQLKEQVDYLKYIKKLKPCELPPFDLMLTFGNEYGSSAKLFVYGIEVVDEGKVFSVEDMFTENTWSYLARDIELMQDIDGEYLPPQITLGDKESAGKFNISDLVGDHDYVKMQEQLEEERKKKEQAIQDAREQAKEYITSIDSIATEDITITGPKVDNDWDIPPELNPDEGEAYCPGLSFKRLEIKDTDVPDKSKGQRFLRVQIDLGKYGRQWSMQNALNGKAIHIVHQCKHIIGNTTKTFGGTAKSTIPAERRGFALHGDPARVDFMIDNYSWIEDGVDAVGSGKGHATKPYLKVIMPDEKITYTFGKETFTFKRVTAGVEVSLDSIGSKDNPVVIKYVLEGSKEEVVTEEKKKMKAKMTTSVVQPKLCNIPGYQYGNNTQPSFLDAKQDLYGVAVVKDTFITDKNAYIHTTRPRFLDPRYHYDIEDMELDDPTVLNTGFKMIVTLYDENGKEVTKKLNKYQLVCDYKVTARIEGRYESVSSEMVIDGEGEKQRYSWWDSKLDSWFQKRRTWKLDILKNTSIIYPNDRDLNFVGMVPYIYEKVHMSSDKNKEAVKQNINSPIEMLKKEVCNCRFKYDYITFEIYNFKVIHTDTKVEIPIEHVGIKSMKFVVLTLDENVVKYINAVT